MTAGSWSPTGARCWPTVVGRLALYETSLPTRWYLPRDDVRIELLEPSTTHTVCAYKGEASYYSLASGAAADVAWYYPEPMHDAARVRDHVCFYAERTDHSFELGVMAPTTCPQPGHPAQLEWPLRASSTS